MYKSNTERLKNLSTETSLRMMSSHWLIRRLDSEATNSQLGFCGWCPTSNPSYAYSKMMKRQNLASVIFEIV